MSITIHPDLLFRIQYFLPRIMLSPISWGDIVIVCQNINYSKETSDADFWQQWYEAWYTLAADYHQMADRSIAAMHKPTALRYYHLAAAAYHWAEFMLFDLPVEKAQARLKVSQCYLAAVDCMHKAPSKLSIPYENCLIDGYYYPSLMSESAPCILLINGLDSAKEVELHAFSTYLREQGFATCFFDGPGQGVNMEKTAMTNNYENVIAAVIDKVVKINPSHASNFGIFGVSYGGYLAMRGACHNQTQIKACVNLSGGFDLDNFGNLSPRIKKDFGYVFKLNSSDMHDLAVDKINLRNSIPYEYPILCVHGSQDAIFPIDNCDKVMNWAKGKVELKIYEQEAHVCQNYFNHYLPYIAGWLLDSLKANFD